MTAWTRTRTGDDHVRSENSNGDRQTGAKSLKQYILSLIVIIALSVGPTITCTRTVYIWIGRNFGLRPSSVLGHIFGGDGKSGARNNPFPVKVVATIVPSSSSPLIPSLQIPSQIINKFIFLSRRNFYFCFTCDPRPDTVFHASGAWANHPNISGTGGFSDLYTRKASFVWRPNSKKWNTRFWNIF